MTSRSRGVDELDDFDAVFGALANRSRRMILTVLHARGGEMTSGAIAARFEHSWPTVSGHLRVLQQAGLVTIELRGREHVYQIQRHRLTGVTRSWLDYFA